MIFHGSKVVNINLLVVDSIVEHLSINGMSVFLPYRLCGPLMIFS
jgi:hypothetical protein